MFKFTASLSDFVKVGNFFVISGYSNKNAENLKIILSCGKNENSDAALVISTNFGSNKISRSSKIDENCTCEESGENPGIESGELFTFCILVGDDRFHVALNDSPYCIYKFQIPCEKIRSIKVLGDIESLIKVNHLQTFPFPFPSIKTDCEDLALEAFIPRTFEAGDVVMIKGKTNGEFVVMFMEDESDRQLIHFNVRFDEMHVVMNTMDLEEEWSPNELRSSSFPFHADTTFKIAFGFTQNVIKVSVNGKFLMDYPLDFIELDSNDETLWEILTGIRIKNGVDSTVKITEVDFIQTGNENLNNLDEISEL